MVLSQRLFASRFNSDPNVINQQITLDGKQYTIVGVMPHGFEFPVQNEPLDLWTTIADDARRRVSRSLLSAVHTFCALIARLKPGVD